MKEGKKQKQKKEEKKNIVYRYDWLLDEARKGGDDNGDSSSNGVQTLQDKIIQFVIYKKKMGLGANGIGNYISPLRKFYWVNGIKGIDWELVRTYMPEFVKKTSDREYYPEEVIAIEDKLDVRGKVVSGVMRGSGVRRGAEPDISVGDLIPMQTKFGKIYKIWVYRRTSDMYATACTPEVAARIDAYFGYRMRFGEVCKQQCGGGSGIGGIGGKNGEAGGSHMHEYYDGNGGEVIQKWFKADERHLDPDAPLIREDFDRKDSLAAKHPKKISYEQISELVRGAAIAAGIRKVNKGEPYKRHKAMNTHGFRKLFKKRCWQAKVDPIILERLLGHKSGNPMDGVTKLMMTYDPEDWAEMQSEFEKAIPNLTITKDALIQAELEKTKEQLRNVPSLERLQAQQRSMQEQMERYERRYEQLTARAMDLFGPPLKELKKSGDLKIPRRIKRYHNVWS